MADHDTEKDEAFDVASSPASGAREITESGIKTHQGVVLEPQPSDDPRDALNWPARKKYSILVVVSLAAFSGLATTLAQNSNLVVQAKAYNVSPTDMSYAITAAIAGLMAGPVLLVPFTRVLGISSILFWSVVGMLVCAVWSASMTSKDDYIGFDISKLFAGLFGALPQVVGNQIIQNMFFRHERGRAYAFYGTTYILGTAVGPTFGGFIIQHVDWPVTAWWTVGMNGLLIVLIFGLVEETGPKKDVPSMSESFLANRIATFLPGSRVVPSCSLTEFIRLYTSPIQIFFSPATILAGLYGMVTFGWAVLINTLLAIYLQTPEAEGGYGFSPQQNAAFLFSLWVGDLVSQAYGLLLNDRVPLALWRRRGGPWKPEYRLHTLWVPGLIIMPIGCGLFGAALQYHLHYMVLALASFLITFAGVVSVPVPINYLVESYSKRPQEVGTVMNVYRLLLGFVIPFFVNAWTAAVTIGWVFGMAAFISIGAFGCIAILMWKGESIRARSIGHVANDEDA